MLGSFALQIKARHNGIAPSLILQSLNPFHRPRATSLQQDFLSLSYHTQHFWIVQHSTGTRTSLLGSTISVYTSSRLGRWQKHRPVKTQSVIHPAFQLEDGQENHFVCPFPKVAQNSLVTISKWNTWTGVSSKTWDHPGNWLRNWQGTTAASEWGASPTEAISLSATFVSGACLLQPHSTITRRLQTYWPSFLYTVCFSSSFIHIYQ